MLTSDVTQITAPRSVIKESLLHNCQCLQLSRIAWSHVYVNCVICCHKQGSKNRV